MRPLERQCGWCCGSEIRHIIWARTRVFALRQQSDAPVGQQSQRTSINILLGNPSPPIEHSIPKEVDTDGYY